MPTTWYVSLLIALVISLIIVYYSILLLETPDGRIVIRTIIPAIAQLRALFDLNMTNIFSCHLLLENGFPMTLKASNIKESDKLFDNISYKLVPVLSCLSNH